MQDDTQWWDEDDPEYEDDDDAGGRWSMHDLILKLDVLGGAHISNVCKQATDVATALGVTVHFVFNGVGCYARPGSDWRTLQEAWEKIYETPEEKRTRFAMAWSAART